VDTPKPSLPHILRLKYFSRSYNGLELRRRQLLKEAGARLPLKRDHFHSDHGKKARSEGQRYENRTRRKVNGELKKIKAIPITDNAGL
jgi:hypothetical protein